MERLITNIRKQGTAELGGVFLENKRDVEAERVNPYILEFETDGEPDFAVERDSVLGKMEYEGMRSMRELALLGKKYLIWLSPPGGLSGYTEGRVVVGKVLEKQGKVKIECRGIPLLRSRDEIRRIALKWMENGGVTMDEIGQVEDVRQESIGVDLESDEALWNKCEEIFGAKEVWNYIRMGKDKVNKNKVNELVDAAVAEIQYRGFKNEGWWLELMMRVRGYEIVGGNHGATNIGLFETIGGGWSPFSSLFVQSEIRFRVEKVDGKLVCPCGERLPEGSTRCPKCGVRLNCNDID